MITEGGLEFQKLKNSGMGENRYKCNRKGNIYDIFKVRRLKVPPWRYVFSNSLGLVKH